MNPDLKDSIRTTRPTDLAPPDLDRIHRRGRRRRIGSRAAAAAGTLAVLALAAAGLGELTARPVALDLVDPVGGQTAGPAATGSAAPSTSPSAPAEPSPSPSPTPAACGDDLPIVVPVPRDYHGPTQGVSPHRTSPVEPVQHLEHWTSETGTIEVRWPADDDAAFWGDPGSVGVDEATEQANGMWRQTLSLPVADVTEEGCTRMQVTVYDKTFDGLDQGVEAMMTGAYLPVGTPLVAEARDADALPSAIGCDTPAGTATPPNQGGQVAGAPHEDPEEALAVFLDEQRTLLPAEYTALRLPDGSIAYVQSDPGGREGYITVIHVIQTTDGWKVDSWDASSC